MQEDAIDLVSARFADLIAQDHHHKLLDNAARQLCRCHSEEHLAAKLLKTLSQRCGVRRALYLAAVDDRHSVLDVLGLPDALKQASAISLRLPEPLHSVIVVDDLPNYALTPLASLQLKAGLALQFAEEAPALVLFDRQPGHHILRDFLGRLGERAAQARHMIRTRHELEEMRNALHRQEKTVLQQSRLLGLMEDWSGVLNLLQDRVAQLDDLLVTAVGTLKADKGSLMLYDDARGELVVRAVHGIEPEAAERVRSGRQSCKKLRLGEGVAGKVAQTLKPMIVNQVEKEPLFLEPELSMVSSIMCLPLHIDGLVLGVLNITHRQPGRRFQISDLQEGMKLAHQAALAINNSRLYHLAVLDPVTDVYTRPHLYHRIQDELNRARRYQRHVSLLTMSVGGPDATDHETANTLEYDLACIAKTNVRITDVVGKLGDGSLAVLLPETDSLGAMFVGERIQQEAEKRGLVVRFGVCSFPDRADSVFKLVARAEAAMATGVFLAPATADLETESA